MILFKVALYQENYALSTKYFNNILKNTMKSNNPTLLYAQNYNYKDSIPLKHQKMNKKNKCKKGQINACEAII
jgi:hypothetical protein